jgi:hypothetical protein
VVCKVGRSDAGGVLVNRRRVFQSEDGPFLWPHQEQPNRTVSDRTNGMNKHHIWFHLQEAHEAIGNILESLRNDPGYDFGNYWVEMQHVYHHVNTTWNGRDASVEQVADGSKEDFNRWACYPKDLEMLQL